MIIHFSDTHLGYQAYDRVSNEGINAREQDVYDAFERIISRILELRPEIVIHSGDFFHRPSPSNRALTFALEQLRRLSDARIPMVLIAGNHETPKTIYNSPILRALRSLDGIHPFFGDRNERIEIGDTVIHGVPHINDNRLLITALQEMKAETGKFNILLLHTSLGKRFLMEEYGEQVFPPEFETTLAQFQYIALGHWHNYQQIDVHPCAWYSGSIERLSDTEIGVEKGFLRLDVQADHTCTIQFEAIETRPWLRWEMNNCHECTIDDIAQSLERFQQESFVPNAILSLTFNDIRTEQTLELGNLRLKQMFPQAFQIIPKRKTWNDRAFVQGIEASQFDSLDKIFADYLRSKYNEDDALATRLVEKSAYYFQLKNQ